MSSCRKVTTDRLCELARGEEIPTNFILVPAKGEVEWVTVWAFDFPVSVAPLGNDTEVRTSDGNP